MNHTTPLDLGNTCRKPPITSQGAAAHPPKFLPELNIGHVYIAGDSLIYCRGDGQTLHSDDQKKRKSLDPPPFPDTTAWAKHAYLRAAEAGRRFNTGTVLVNCSSREGGGQQCTDAMIIPFLFFFFWGAEGVGGRLLNRVAK